MGSAGRIRDEGETCHLGLHDDGCAAVQLDENPFGNSIDGGNALAVEQSIPLGSIWRDLDGAIGDIGKLHPFDDAADDGF